MPREINQVVLILADGTSQRIKGQDAKIFQDLIAEAIALLPPDRAKKFHNLHWQDIKVTSKVTKLKGS